MKREEMLWVEKYRPKAVSDCILPLQTQKTLQGFVNKKELPNLLLFSTTPGSGKTSAALAMMDELGYDYLFINASLERSIDLLRTKIAEFASTSSMTGGRKFIFLDEADGMTSLFQDSLRHYIEEFSISCGFILTCNNVDNLINPIRSRLLDIDFNFKKADLPRLMGLFMARIKAILDQNNITYHDKTIAELIKKYAPDFRRVINELQGMSITGSIDNSILLNDETDVDELVGFIKTKNIGGVRQWLENNQVDTGRLYTVIYNRLYKVLKPASIPDMIITIANYMRYDNTIANKNLNMTACITEIMLTATFND